MDPLSVPVAFRRELSLRYAVVAFPSPSQTITRPEIWQLGARFDRSMWTPLVLNGGYIPCQTKNGSQIYNLHLCPVLKWPREGNN
jgi:hypothetical protein